MTYNVVYFRNYDNSSLETFNKKLIEQKFQWYKQQSFFSVVYLNIIEIN